MIDQDITVPIPYNPRVEISSSGGGTSIKLKWDGVPADLDVSNPQASGIFYLVKVTRVNDDFSHSVPVGWEKEKVFVAKEFDINFTNPNGDNYIPRDYLRRRARYCFQVRTAIGILTRDSNGFFDSSSEDVSLSDYVCTYSSLYPNYEHLLELKDDGSLGSIPQDLSNMNFKLKWVINGEPLSGLLSGNISQGDLLKVSRVVGDSIDSSDSNLTAELSHGTFNRLPKQLHYNDLILRDKLNNLQGGIEESVLSLNRSLHRGYVSSIYVYPDQENGSPYNAKTNSYVPTILVNSSDSAPMQDAKYMLYSGSVWTSTSITSGFTFDLFPKEQRKLLISGRKYLVTIDIAYNQIYASSGAAYTFYCYLRMLIKSQTIMKKLMFRSVCASTYDYNSHRTSGWTTNQYYSKGSRGAFIITMDDETIEGGMKCSVSWDGDLKGGQTPVAPCSISMRICEFQA